MQSIVVGGRAIHVAVRGPADGLPVVFLNSLGTDLRVWDPLLPHLPEGLRVVRMDKRGHGLSDRGAAGWSIDDLADDVAAVLEAVGVRGAVVCGLSVGGIIAQSLAARRPDLVRALVLSNTAAKIGPAETWAERIRAVEAGGIEALADPIMERWFSPRFRAEDPTLALWRNMLVRQDPVGYAATCAAIRDADYTESTRGLRLPALVIAGEVDGATPPDLVRGTAALIEGARFVLLPGVGHLPCVEAPAAFMGQLRAFLREVGDE